MFLCIPVARLLWQLRARPSDGYLTLCPQALIVAFQLGLELPGQRPSQNKDGFLSVVGVFLDAGLVPLIIRTQAVAEHRV